MNRYVMTGLIIAGGILLARIVGKFFGIGVTGTTTSTTT